MVEKNWDTKIEIYVINNGLDNKIKDIKNYSTVATGSLKKDNGLVLPIDDFSYFQIWFSYIMEIGKRTGMFPIFKLNVFDDNYITKDLNASEKKILREKINETNEQVLEWLQNNMAILSVIKKDVIKNKTTKMLNHVIKDEIKKQATMLAKLSIYSHLKDNWIIFYLVENAYKNIREIYYQKNHIDFLMKQIEFVLPNGRNINYNPENNDITNFIETSMYGANGDNKDWTNKYTEIAKFLEEKIEGKNKKCKVILKEESKDLQLYKEAKMLVTINSWLENNNIYKVASNNSNEIPERVFLNSLIQILNDSKFSNTKNDVIEEKITDAVKNYSSYILNLSKLTIDNNDIYKVILEKKKKEAQEILMAIDSNNVNTQNRELYNIFNKKILINGNEISTLEYYTEAKHQKKIKFKIKELFNELLLYLYLIAVLFISSFQINLLIFMFQVSSAFITDFITSIFFCNIASFFALIGIYNITPLKNINRIGKSIGILSFIFTIILIIVCILILFCILVYFSTFSIIYFSLAHVFLLIFPTLIMSVPLLNTLYNLEMGTIEKDQDDQTNVEKKSIWRKVKRKCSKMSNIFVHPKKTFSKIYNSFGSFLHAMDMFFLFLIISILGWIVFYTRVPSSILIEVIKKVDKVTSLSSLHKLPPLFETSPITSTNNS